jgi:ABC-2 type transport system permease protein
MRPVLLLARRELGAFLNTAWGYFILAAVLLIDGLWFNALSIGDSAKFSSDVLESFFEVCAGTTMVAGPLITMRLLAEERQTGTLVILETAPVTETQVVLGKFLGAFGFVALMTIITLYMPALIFVNGKVSWEQIGAGYLGVLSLGAAVVSIGTFGSAVARSQLVAAIISGLIVTLFVVMWLVSKIADSPVSELLSYMALYERHFDPFRRGRINTESLVFYGSLVSVFLGLAVRSLQARRWQ